MEIKAQITALEQKTRLKKGQDGEMEEEKIFVMKAALKKERYEKDTENLVQGTGNPWAAITIQTWDEGVFKEFEKKSVGDKITLVVK